MTHEPIENINNFSLKIKYLKKIIFYSIFNKKIIFYSILVILLQSGNIKLSTNEIGSYYQSSSSIKNVGPFATCVLPKTI